jgi:hypothetical protein
MAECGVVRARGVYGCKNIATVQIVRSSTGGRQFSPDPHFRTGSGHVRNGLQCYFEYRYSNL